MMTSTNIKKPSTTIQGTPPTWSDDEFNRRLHVRLHAYENTSASTVLVTHALEHEWLKLVSQHVADGYTIDRRWPIFHAQLVNSVPMTKPEALRAKDKEEIKKKVKDEYIDYLQAKLDEYKTKLTQQLIEAAEEKERRTLERAKAKRFADAEKEAQECFGDLVVPEGFPNPRPQGEKPAFSLSLADIQ